jgi:hypothetical protein
MINKIWNIAHFNGTFVLSFNQPFLDLLKNLIKNRLTLNFCHKPATLHEQGVYVTVVDRDDACILSDCVEQALASGLRDGAMAKFFERLSEQLKYISNQSRPVQVHNLGERRLSKFRF